MKAEDVLNALPVNYYVIDLKTKTILHTNDASITDLKEPCFRQIFNESRSCMNDNNMCFCEQALKIENPGELVIETGEAGKKRYYRANLKKINHEQVLACFTEVTREKSIQKDLKISRKRLERAESLASFGTWEIDLEKQVLLGSKGACNIYGLDAGVLPLSQVKMIPLPEYRQLLDNELDDLIQGRRQYNIRFRIKRPNDGEIRYVHSVAEYRSEKKMVFGIIKDITEKVYFKNALQESVADLQLAQDIARIGNWKYDPVTGTLTTSDPIKQIIAGYEIPSQPELKSFEKITGKEHFALFSSAIMQALYKGVPFEKQFKIKNSDNAEKWIEIICRPDEEGSQWGHVLRGTLQDITATKTAENELQHSNNLFRTLIHNLPDAIYMKDSDCRKIIANDGDAHNCGRQSPQEVIGKTDYDIYPKEIADRYFQDDRQVMEKGIPVINREEVLPGHPKRWILTTKVPLIDKKGRITGLVGIGHDITRRKQMEEELKAAKLRAEESDRLKSVFLANMSHEIRTPLNGILGFSNFICSENTDPRQFRGYYGLIEACAQQLTSVIDNIIDISLIQSNQLKLNCSSFNFIELLNELYAGYKKQKEVQLVDVDFRLTNFHECNAQGFCSDRARIGQVLKNLLDNAFKFTSQGYIEFGCLESEQGELNFYVEDTGIGIEESKLEVIFENFRQVEEGFTRQYEGAGLGLSVASGIIARLGGTISVKSKPGYGSTFYVSIPEYKGESATEVKTVKRSNNVATVKKEEKLIVSFEDDPASMEYLRSVAGLLGCRLINFDNPVKGLDYIRRNRTDLIFMDVRLPEMSGFEATQIIKNEFPNLPVIIQSAYAMKEDMEKAFMAGCDDYLAKPVPLKELRGTIKYYIQE